jgi:hypothetical protein
MKRVKMLKTVTQPPRIKGLSYMVTDRNAAILIAAGLAELEIETEQIEPEPEQMPEVKKFSRTRKENKEASKRKTK